MKTEKDEIFCSMIKAAAPRLTFRGGVQTTGRENCANPLYLSASKTANASKV